MVVPAALSAERQPAPPARGPRVPVALSLALHGLAIVPLLLAGTSGSSASEDQPAALMVELSLAAPTAGPAAEADQPETLPEPQQPPEPPTPPVEHTEATPEPEPEPPPPPQEVAAVEPEIKLDLPPPDEPPPPTAAEMKPVAPPKPKPAAAPRPMAQAAVTKAPSPDVGNASVTQQQAAASSSLVVFEGKPRFRIPPTPAVYPPRSIELGQQGEVMVRVRLEPDGSAAEITVWRSSNFPLLDRAALTAVRGWHFLPALRDGRPVAAWVEIPVRFHLR